MQTETDEKYMKMALDEALKALKSKDVPVGAVVVYEGKVISTGRNRREKDKRPTAHAEVVAIDRAAKKLKRWNLSGATLYVTLEPCAMCAGAIIYSRISRVVFGAFDLRFGCAGSIHDLLSDTRFNHRPEVTSGVLKDECLAPIQEFFKALRKKGRNESEQS